MHPILKLGIETNTPMHHWNAKQIIFDSLGNMLPEEKTDRLSTLLWKFIEEAFDYSAEAHKDRGYSIPVDDSLYDFIQRRCGEELEDEEDRETLLQMSEIWGTYVGEPVWKQSLRFAWMEECCGGGKNFLSKAHGTFMILQRGCLSNRATLLYWAKYRKLPRIEQKSFLEEELFLFEHLRSAPLANKAVLPPMMALFVNSTR